MQSVLQAIRDRRSHKAFSNSPISEDDLRTILESAVLAPNHKMTQPWSFAVLGKLAKRKYAEIKAALRVASEDPAVAEEKRQKLVAEHSAVPAVIVVMQKMDGDAHRKREDYAAMFMAIQNMLLVATSLGLGSKVLTGDILNAVPMRELVHADEQEQIVAILHIGEPADEPKPKVRVSANERTRWLP